MQITWYGQSCFKIVSGKNTVVLAPFSKSIGLTPPRGKADILLVSDSNLTEDDFSQIDANFVISGAGEYEIGGIHVSGISIFHKDKDDIVKKSTAYILEFESIRICHLADFSKEQVIGILDKVGQIDILMVPVGGSYDLDKKKIKSLSAEQVMSVVTEIDPRVVVPMNFKVPGLKLSLDGAEKFLKSAGAADVKAQDKYTIKKRDLPQGTREVILMKVA